MPLADFGERRYNEKNRGPRAARLERTEMPIRVKYNSDLKFRRRAAFRNFYRARDSRLRFGVELGLAAVCAVVCFVLWQLKSTSRVADIAFFTFAILGIYLLGRLLRVAFSLRRIKPLSEFLQAREYRFWDNGFAFGPTDQAGSMLETRWREVDHAYEVDGVVYLLCKNKAHWAPVDLSLVIEGDRDALLELLKYNIPGKRWSKR